jgi:uncharacterized membrane protein
VINLPEETQPAVSPVPAKSSDQNLMAAICYLWIVSIIILLTRKDNEFIQFHAKQATVLFGLWVVLWVLSAFVGILFIVWWILDLVLFIAAVIGFIKAYGGEKYRLPLIADLADKIKI